MVNSFFLTCFNWLRKLNSAAFFCNFANLFSYFETLRNEGLMLRAHKKKTYFGLIESEMYLVNIILQFATEVIHENVDLIDLFNYIANRKIFVRIIHILDFRYISRQWLLNECRGIGVAHCFINVCINRACIHSHAIEHLVKGKLSHQFGCLVGL